MIHTFYAVSAGREGMSPQSFVDGVGAVRQSRGHRARLCIEAKCEVQVLRNSGLTNLQALTGSQDQRVTVFLPFAQLLGDMVSYEYNPLSGKAC